MLLFNSPNSGVISSDPTRAELDFQRRWNEAMRRHPNDPRAQGQLMDDWQFGREVFSDGLNTGSVSDRGVLGRVWDYLTKRSIMSLEGTPLQRYHDEHGDFPRDPLLGAPAYWLYRGAYVGVGAILLILGLASLVFVKSGSLRPEVRFSPVAKAEVGGS